MLLTLCHQHSDPLPEIPLFPDTPATPNVQISSTPEPDIPSHAHSRTHTVVSGELTAEITTHPYTVTFKSTSSGRVLTFAGYKHQAMYDVPYEWTTSSATNTSCLTNDPSSNPSRDLHPASVRYINSELNISPGEVFWGLGEQFGTFAKNGSLEYAIYFDRARADIFAKVNQLLFGIRTEELHLSKPTNVSHFTFRHADTVSSLIIPVKSKWKSAAKRLAEWE